MAKGRITTVQTLFIVYIVSVNSYLQAKLTGDPDPRGIMLGMTTDELTKLADFVKKFISNDALHPGYWDLHSNKDTKNKATRANMLNCMKEFRAFFRPLLNRMSGSAVITSPDRLKLNIAEPDTPHAVKKTAIKATTSVDVKMLGSGKMRFECRASSDSQRASKAEGADAVEVWYSSLPFGLVAATVLGETASKVKPRQMVGPEEATNHEIYTKAIFIMTFSSEHLGNNLQFFVRWINTKHPELNGPWSILNSTVIS
jgi:hypothetical protein